MVAGLLFNDRPVESDQIESGLMTKQILTLWSIGVLVLGMSGIAFGQSLNNANGSNNGNAYGRGNSNNGNGKKGNGPSNGYGNSDGIQSVAVPEIDPSGAAYAIALLSGALLVIRGRQWLKWR
jgi:hypothetical protein